VSNSIEDLMIHMKNYRPIEMGKWIEAIQEESNNKKKNS